METTSAVAQKGALKTADVERLLQRGDIVLINGRDIISRLIQFGTKSYWNHVALVFVLGDTATGSTEGYQHTFIIEAQAQEGVDVHSIDKYLKDEKRDMAILRLPKDSIPPDIRLGYMKRLRAFTLEEIEAVYSFDVVAKLINKIFGVIGRPFAAIMAAGNLLFRTSGTGKAVNRWICSGVVQYAYFRACFGEKPGQLPMWSDFFQEHRNLSLVVFEEDTQAKVANGLSYQEALRRLRVTTPAHFASATLRGDLEVVAVRLDREWSTKLTRS